MEELIELLQKLKFWKTTVCNCTHNNSDKIEDIIDKLTCDKCTEEYYTLKTDNGIYKVHMIDTKFDFVRIEFVWENGAAVDTFVNIKDFKQKLNSYSELKSLIRKSKIKSIIQMNEDTLMKEYIKEFRKILDSLGFQLLNTGSTHSDIYILNTDEIHYRVIVNNIDIDYSNSEKIEFEWFNKITNTRRGLNWHVKSSSVRQAIDRFFYYLPELKAVLRKNKIEKILQ